MHCGQDRHSRGTWEKRHDFTGNLLVTCRNPSSRPYRPHEGVGSRFSGRRDHLAISFQRLKGSSGLVKGFRTLLLMLAASLISNAPQTCNIGIYREFYGGSVMGV